MNSFHRFITAVQKQAEALTRNHRTLFITGIGKDDLWETYLSSFPAGTNELYKERSEHDCNSCRQFIRHFGSVVAIEENALVSVWEVENLEAPYTVVAEKLAQAVKSFPIENTYLAAYAKIGTASNIQELENGKFLTWEHLYCELPEAFVVSGENSIESVQGQFRDSKNVFKRAMDELTTDAGNTVLELIDQNSLYRGAEFKHAVTEFLAFKEKYEKLQPEQQDNWCWLHSLDNSVARIRNTALGTLLIDLSEGCEIDVAVTKFEKVMAPNNYKRPNAVFTKKMVDAAQKQIEELGYSESLGRRFAVTEDITVNNVLFVNRDTKKKMGGSVFDDLKEEVRLHPKTFNKVEEVGIEDFIENILPKARNIELMVEGKHESNLISLIAPENRDAPSMLKWSNNFSWAYNGDIADSMKQNVKNAGGNVEGVLRFSIQWNDVDNNQNDFDAHCIEPGGHEIYYSYKLNLDTTGQLDVDIITPGDKVAVENITWTDIQKMREGKYTFFVRNFSHRGGKSGFSAEIEYAGEIYSFAYHQELKQKEDVVVAELNFSRKEGIRFIKSLEHSTQSKEIWGIKTQKFTKVAMVMFSPNYWDDQVGIGNKHYFFILDGCKNENQPRGFFNEFLKESLTPHRKVFEALGSRMRVEPSEQQLSGIGFSSTQRNSIVAKVDGSFQRIIKINF